VMLIGRRARPCSGTTRINRDACATMAEWRGGCPIGPRFAHSGACSRRNRARPGGCRDLRRADVLGARAEFANSSASAMVARRQQRLYSAPRALAPSPSPGLFALIGAAAASFLLTRTLASLLFASAARTPTPPSYILRRTGCSCLTGCSPASSRPRSPRRGGADPRSRCAG